MDVWPKSIKMQSVYENKIYTRGRRMNPDCPACNSVLVEIRAGLYCWNTKCTHYGQKVIACCEGGEC